MLVARFIARCMPRCELCCCLALDAAAALAFSGLTRVSILRRRYMEVDATMMGAGGGRFQPCVETSALWGIIIQLVIVITSPSGQIDASLSTWPQFLAQIIFFSAVFHQWLLTDGQTPSHRCEDAVTRTRSLSLHLLQMMPSTP